MGSIYRFFKMQLSKIFLSETPRPRAFIFSIKHHLEVLYQSCSNYAPGVLYYWLHCDLWPFPQVSVPGPSCFIYLILSRLLTPRTFKYCCFSKCVAIIATIFSLDRNETLDFCFDSFCQMLRIATYICVSIQVLYIFMKIRMLSMFCAFKKSFIYFFKFSAGDLNQCHQVHSQTPIPLSYIYRY